VTGVQYHALGKHVKSVYHKCSPCFIVKRARPSGDSWSLSRPCFRKSSMGMTASLSQCGDLLRARERDCLLHSDKCSLLSIGHPARKEVQATCTLFLKGKLLAQAGSMPERGGCAPWQYLITSASMLPDRAAGGIWEALKAMRPSFTLPSVSSP
jgi:hypothetical protein